MKNDNQTYTINHVAQTVANGLKVTDLHLVPFEILFKHQYGAVKYQLQKHFEINDRYPTKKVLRRIQALAVKAAIAENKEVPYKVLEFHQFAPDLFEIIREYSSKRKVKLDYLPD